MHRRCGSTTSPTTSTPTACSCICATWTARLRSDTWWCRSRQTAAACVCAARGSRPGTPAACGAGGGAPTPAIASPRDRVARAVPRPFRGPDRVRSDRQRDAPRTGAAGGAAGLERRRWVGVVAGGSAGGGALRDLGAGRMIVVVLHEPQDLVNIAHVVRAMKNFGFQDLRLVAPRGFDAYRVEGIAHQTRDVLARVRVFERLEEALADW